MEALSPKHNRARFLAQSCSAINGTTPILKRDIHLVVLFTDSSPEAPLRLSIATAKRRDNVSRFLQRLGMRRAVQNLVLRDGAARRPAAN